jgi:hypothetical protein
MSLAVADGMRVVTCCLVSSVFALGCSASRTPGQIDLETADPARGITGDLVDDDGTSIEFRSRVDERGALRATITAGTGEVLVDFGEELSAIPRLAVLGVVYDDLEAASEDALLALATRPEGALVRRLARELVSVAGDPGLVRERLGLEVAFQASQHYFTDEATPVVRTTDDYVESPSGYVTKHLDRRLIMRRNYQAALPEGLFHDDLAVGECFGVCGEGCGSWTDTLVEVTGFETIYHPPNTWGDCPVSGGWEHVYTGNCEHKACGCKTHGCAAHDWCVRELCGGDATGPCAMTQCNIPDPLNPFTWTIVWAGISSVSCLWRGDTCWVYYGPCATERRESYCADPCCEEAVTRAEQIACGGCRY